jgi:hypothetical protein
MEGKVYASTPAGKTALRAIGLDEGQTVEPGHLLAAKNLIDALATLIDTQPDRPTQLPLLDRLETVYE